MERQFAGVALGAGSAEAVDSQNGPGKVDLAIWQSYMHAGALYPGGEPICTPRSRCSVKTCGTRVWAVPAAQLR